MFHYDLLGTSFQIDVTIFGNHIMFLADRIHVGRKKDNQGSDKKVTSTIVLILSSNKYLRLSAKLTTSLTCVESRLIQGVK